MEKMRIEASSPDGFTLNSRGKYPAICIISNLHFHDTKPILHLNINWLSKGKYTNGQRKKLVARTIRSLLLFVVNNERRKLKHTSKGTK